MLIPGLTAKSVKQERMALGKSNVFEVLGLRLTDGAIF